MRTLITILLTSVTLLTGNLVADGVAPGSVSAEAKWLIHLNLDAFRGSNIGSILFENVIKPQVGEDISGLRIKTDEVYEGVHAITAYGKSFNKDFNNIGVLLIKTEPRLRAIVEATLIQQEAAASEETQVRTIQVDPYMVYSLMGDQVFAAILPDETLVVSKSLDQLADAVDVVEDRARGLDEATGGFSRLSTAGDTFFFLATAEGFNESSLIPPQARVLQLADAARLALGETADDLALDLILQARDETTRTQLQKIIEGLLALASFTELGSTDFGDIVMNTNVTHSGNDVNLTMHYPVDRILQLVDSVNPPAPPRPPHAIDDVPEAPEALTDS